MTVSILTGECVAQREAVTYTCSGYNSWAYQKSGPESGWPVLPLGHFVPALPLQETLGRVAESGLPALLLQCLYLFFVFPLEKDELFENDLQVQRMFVQVSERRG